MLERGSGFDNTDRRILGNLLSLILGIGLLSVILDVIILVRVMQ